MDHETLKRDVERRMKELDRQTKIALSSKKKARQFLVEAGICTPKGKLTARYR